MSLKLQDPNTNLQGAIRELQGYTKSVLAGNSVDTKIDLAAIRAEDSILSVLEFDPAGPVFADRTSEASVTDIRADGTITLASVVAGDTVTIGGQVFEAIDGDTNGANSGRANTGIFKFGIGVSDTESGTNLRDAINEYFGLQANGVTATRVAGVVTVVSTLEGAVGNATTLVENTSGSTIVVDNATLTGGTDTGGIQLDSTDTTGHQLIVEWYNRK